MLANCALWTCWGNIVRIGIGCIHWPQAICLHPVLTSDSMSHLSWLARCHVSCCCQKVSVRCAAKQYCSTISELYVRQYTVYCTVIFLQRIRIVSCTGHRLQTAVNRRLIVPNCSPCLWNQLLHAWTLTTTQTVKADLWIISHVPSTENLPELAQIICCEAFGGCLPGSYLLFQECSCNSKNWLNLSLKVVDFGSTVLGLLLNVLGDQSLRQWQRAQIYRHHMMYMSGP